MNAIYALTIIIVTVLLYNGMKGLYKRVNSPLFVPIATTTLVLIIILSLLNMSYNTYMIGGKWIDELLGPAVVALAFPLYQNKATLKRYFTPIFVSVFIGTMIALFTGIYFSLLLKIDQKILISILPKSVTSPVAMDIADIIGGVPTLAAVYVMIAGISGAMFGPIILKKSGISHFIGVGLGFGTAAHGIGTAKALEIGKREAAISSVSMILSAIFSSILYPYIILFFL